MPRYMYINVNSKLEYYGNNPYIHVYNYSIVKILFLTNISLFPYFIIRVKNRKVQYLIKTLPYRRLPSPSG